MYAVYKDFLPHHIEEDKCLCFTFQDSDGNIELILNEKKKYPYNGWSVISHVNPSRVCI